MTMTMVKFNGTLNGQRAHGIISIYYLKRCGMLGRFGHHPDPAVDFCEEVDIIEGLVYDCAVGNGDRKATEDRIFKAMQFQVGGVERAVSAKASLRKAEKKLHHSSKRLK